MQVYDSHFYFLSELSRQRRAELEREAELRRLLPRRERRRLTRVALPVRWLLRRGDSVHATSAEAHTCR